MYHHLEKCNYHDWLSEWFVKQSNINWSVTNKHNMLKMWWSRQPWFSWEDFLQIYLKDTLKVLWINCVYLCSTGSFSNMSGGRVSWPKESTNRIILEYWAFYVVNVFMRALQIHKSLKMLFIVHKRFLPNYVQNYKYTSTKDKMQQHENRPS